jgi:hypothetical protein
MTGEDKKNSMVWVRHRTIPTEWPPLVGEVIANFCGQRVPHGQRDGSLRPYSRFYRQEPLLFYQVAPQLYSQGWVDPVPYIEALIFREVKIKFVDPWNSYSYLYLWVVGGHQKSNYQSKPHVLVTNMCQYFSSAVSLINSFSGNQKCNCASVLLQHIVVFVVTGLEKPVEIYWFIMWFWLSNHSAIHHLK